MARVLVIDDARFMEEALALSLTHFGHHVEIGGATRHVDHGVDAFAPDCIVIDLALPDVLTAVRRELTDVPIIGIGTGPSDAVSVCLPRPVPRETLGLAVELVLATPAEPITVPARVRPAQRVAA